VMRLATTSTYRSEGRLLPHATPPYLRVGLARSLAAMLPAGPAEAALLEQLRVLDPNAAPPIELPADAFRAAGPAATSLYDLLANTDPERFDELHDALPEEIRAAVRALSPIHVASKLRAPVELATAPRDPYFPVAEAHALAATASDVRLTVTSLLTHATPRLSLRYVAELLRLDTFFVRALARATARG
jgi:hypothetical protein